MFEKIEKANLMIKHYMMEFNSDEITTPKYQRDHCWKSEFESKLINSILDGVDLPKIYLGKIKETGETHLIDGGHRSRTIDRFMKNEFSIVRNQKNVFYNKVFEKDTKGKTNLSEEEKKNFDNYTLDVVTYVNINEKECRNIFNNLQNAQPMSIEDVINSWQSDLVDYVRDLLDESIEIDNEKNTVREWYEKYSSIMGKTKPEKTKIMTHLLSLFTIFFPQTDNEILNPNFKEKEELSRLYLAKGNNKNSPCLNYVKEYKAEITGEISREFIEKLSFIFSYFIQNKNIFPTYLYTLIHAKENHENFSIEKYETLLENVKNYEKLKKEADTFHKSKNFDESLKKSKDAETLNDENDKHLETWFRSRKDDHQTGMKKRYQIVLKTCL